MGAGVGGAGGRGVAKTGRTVAATDGVGVGDIEGVAEVVIDAVGVGELVGCAVVVGVSVAVGGSGASADVVVFGNIFTHFT